MRVPNRHYCAAMRAELQHEQHVIAARFETASERDRQWLREQLEANERAFRRLRIRAEKERNV